MGHNDPLVDAVTAAGVRTWSTEEMAAELLALCTAAGAREQAAAQPVVTDLTGGLADVDLDLAALATRGPRGAGGRAGTRTTTDRRCSR